MNQSRPDPQFLTRRVALRRSGVGIAAALAATAGLRSATTAHATPAASPSAVGGTEEFVLGALLDLSGDWSTLGLASQAALAIAADEINEELTLVGSPVRVRVLVEDTRLEPDLAREKLQLLASQGARVLIGPQSSAEVAAVKDDIDGLGLLLISQGSTASSLAIAGDNVFRLVPADTHEIEALIALLEADGIRVVVPIWRDDPGNAGLHNAMARLFPERGGTVLDGVAYPAASADLSAAVASLSAQVEQATADHDPATVAIHLAAFDEVVGLFELARQDPTLSAVRWYGSDGVALIEALPADPAAAAFAVAVDYPNPLLGLSDEARARWEPIADRIEEQTGRPPDAFGLAAYDAAWVATLAYLETGRSDNPAALREALVRTANRYIGATGPTTLDEAGDRSTGDFDFWAVREADGGYAWQRVARYASATGQIRREEDAATPEATPTS